MTLLYHIAILLILAWGIANILAQHSGFIGKTIHFVVTLEAGSICFPASLTTLPAPQSMIAILAFAIFYNEVMRKVCL